MIISLIIVGSISAGVISLNSTTGKAFSYDLKNFSTYDELKDYLGSLNQENSGQWYAQEDSLQISMPRTNMESGSVVKDSAGGESVDYSSTNVQVEGVDEPDIVKTDGTYLYVLSEQKIYIILAYPAENARVLSTLEFDEFYPQNIFIDENKLVVLGGAYTSGSKYEDMIWWGGITNTVIKVYDVSDHLNPTISREVEIDGGYFDSRLINGIIYVISTESTYNIYQKYDDNETFNIPRICIDGNTEEIPASEIYYVDIPEPPTTFTHVLSLDIQDDSAEVIEKSFLLGGAQSLYVSKNNIFLTYTMYNYGIIGLVDTISSNDDSETTLIHRISISNGAISYDAQGEVAGHVLNQFSMDEYNGFFRIATTSGQTWNGESSNNVYILDMNLEQVGEIENIAPGESIYSARFMGDKAYLVTFVKIDPFFTIDVSDPYNPEIIGELKIPGYSDYLHPYDKDHIIGVGKETVEGLEDELAWRNLEIVWYQGVKMALFDVSDFENPSELDKIIIGDRGSDSPALHDHKAFLFDKDKELLVIPVSVYEIDEEYKEEHGNYTGSYYGEFIFQGAYIYKLNLDGFEYQGRITHMKEGESDESRWYWYSTSAITRSLYIGDTLYTISEEMVKMNNLDTLEEINSVELA